MRWLLAFSVVCFCLADISYAEDKKIALVIGNGQYTGRVTQLNNPERDAKRMADTLEEIGFDVQVGYNLDHETMRAAFKHYVDRLHEAGPEAIGVFYFAGHGLQGAGSNFLLPIGAQPRIIQDLFMSAPTLQGLVNDVDRVGNRANFFILDACRDNPLTSATWDVSNGLVSPKRTPGMFFGFSTGAGQTASDGGNKYPNSPYTRALTNWLLEPLVLETMFKRVTGQVVKETEGHQTPYEVNGMFEEDFYFTRRAYIPPNEAIMAEFIAASTPCEYKLFAEKYPNNTHSPVAASIGEACQPDEMLEEDEEDDHETVSFTYEYIGADFDFGVDAPELAGDEVCSDRRFTGALMAKAPWRASYIGQDATDCQAGWDVGGLVLRTPESLQIAGLPQVYKGLDFGTDQGTFANDGLCHDARFKGHSMAPEDQVTDTHSDRSDCLVAFIAGKVKPHMGNEL